MIIGPREDDEVYAEVMKRLERSLGHEHPDTQRDEETTDDEPEPANP